MYTEAWFSERAIGPTPLTRLAQRRTRPVIVRIPYISCAQTQCAQTRDQNNPNADGCQNNLHSYKASRHLTALLCSRSTIACCRYLIEQTFRAKQKKINTPELLSTATDIFALGSVYCTIMTGNSPSHNLCGEDTLALFKQGRFPETKTLGLVSYIVQKCWQVQYKVVIDVY